ncbi:hypothetical protein PsAD2_01296 [Pseudovibrio axinellae]|uniref:Regulator of CtrA degradation n=1 Tax=Pseudovibrio axinellae TaxID=989403 RepID=A0A166AAW4_9HYPH|nr:DUF1465 family protein [Pseudovibrio axinellae]KZL20807.1 hypothetical protein PsAD2_01296 [Pseudovibrio axinellae]SER21942.1 regulator of CtrA degradation [Pseudovibrio axinellae]
MGEFSTDTKPEATCNFAKRLMSSQNFTELFREGMALIEETASYLAGPGRSQSKALGPAASLAYATESMRLTTRLMQLASWLLLQRAVNGGEILQSEAQNEKNKIRIDKSSKEIGSPAWQDLPEKLRFLISESFRLQKRIKHVDSMLKQELLRETAANTPNPVADQLSQITAAFK